MAPKWVSTAIATGLWSGKAPVAPGTFGSLAAVLFWFVLSLGYDSLAFRLGVLVLITGIGWLATSHYIAELAGEEKIDPSEVVIDEWAGMLLVLTIVPASSAWQILTAFCLFRLYDIIKFWPISALEKLPGTAGIMLDDLAAGLLALVSLLGIRTLLVAMGVGH